MPMAPKLQVVAVDEGVGGRDLGALQSGESGHSNEGLAMAGVELVRHGAVLRVEDAAGGVDKPSAGLHQPRRRGQDGALDRPQGGDSLGRLAPLEVGMTA